MPPTKLEGSRGRGHKQLRRSGLFRPIPCLLAIGLLGGPSACDIPTEAPEWDQRWIVPADETTVGVENLLPDGVSITSGGTTFDVSVAPLSFNENLGVMCAVCAANAGAVMAKPSFQYSLQEEASLPDEVTNTSVQEGQIQVVANNGLNFDPLRPGAGATGSLTMSLYDGSVTGTLLDQITVSGANESFAPGASMVKTMEFSGTIGESLLVVVDVNSPAGDPVTINVNQTLAVAASVPTLEVSSALIDVSGQELIIDDTDMDLEDLDEAFVNRIQSGAIDLEVDNPWSIGASFTLTIRTGSTTISKSFSVQPGTTSTARVEFTGEELRSFLGKNNVILGGSGLVAPSAGSINLSPGQVLTLDTTLDLVIRVGGGSD